MFTGFSLTVKGVCVCVSVCYSLSCQMMCVFIGYQQSASYKDNWRVSTACVRNVLEATGKHICVCLFVHGYN